MIDKTKPWFPQDYTLDEVLEAAVKPQGFSHRDQDNHLRNIERDYHIRKGGVAGVFNDLRNRVLEAVGEPDPNGGHIVIDHKAFKEMITHEIAGTIYTLEGSSIPDTKFVIQEYAVPVFRRDDPPEYNCKPELLEVVRPATAKCRIIDKYWELVNT